MRWPLHCSVQSEACAPALGSQESRPAGPLCSPSLQALSPDKGLTMSLKPLKRGDLSASVSPRRGFPSQASWQEGCEAADLRREFSITFTCAWSKKGKEGGREPSGSGTQRESH